MASFSTQAAKGSAGKSGQTTVKGRYDALTSVRSGVLERARTAAEITIPGLLPRAGSTETNDLPIPNQSMGARSVTNLSSRLMIALFPPNRSFFRFRLPKELQEEFEESGEFEESQIENALAENEQIVTDKFESTASRQQVFIAIQHLIVAGNYMLKVEEDNSLRGFRLDQFVVSRDARGNVKEIVTQENVAWETLDKRIRRKVAKPDISVSQEVPANTADSNKVGGNDIDVYTQIKFDPSKRKKKRWVVKQEIDGKIVQTGSFEVNPFLPIRWFAVSGENYGRSHVEENIGDLAALDGLSKSILDAAVASARILLLRNPAGLTKEEDLARGENGDIINGREDDVAFLQVGKFADMQVAAQEAGVLRDGIGFAFLLNTSLQRDGERVTATEIRTLAQELEGTLGGVFSHLANELQRPYLRRMITQLQKNGELAVFDETDVKFEILTGLEALGREADLVNIQTLTQLLQALPESAQDTVKWNQIVKKIVIALNLDLESAVKSNDELEAEQATEFQQQIAVAGAQSAAESGGQVAGQNIAQAATG